MQLGGLGERCKLPRWAKPQPTKDLVHIQGQNNSFRSNIFVGFAEDKIEDFAKLKLKMHFIGLIMTKYRFSTTKSGRAKNRLCPQGLKSERAVARPAQ